MNTSSLLRGKFQIEFAMGLQGLRGFRFYGNAKIWSDDVVGRIESHGI